MAEFPDVFVDDGGDCEVLDFLRDVMRRDRKAFAKCEARLKALAAGDIPMRRPYVDTVRGPIKELRIDQGRVHYRFLFARQTVNSYVILAAVTKEGVLPEDAIQRAETRFEKWKERKGDNGS